MYTDKTDSSLSILKITGEAIHFVSEVSLPKNWRSPSLDRIFPLYPMENLLCLKELKRRNVQTPTCVGFPEQQKLKGNRILN